MKNNKGFTLIELIAVVVILAVIMLVAVPNVVSTINKNKKEAFIEDAKKFRASVEAKISSDTSINKPNDNTILIFPLEKVTKASISESPYGLPYSKSKSYVAVVKAPIQIQVSETETINKNQLQYYVHLVICKVDDCKDTDVEARYGINLENVDNLNESKRFEKVKQADDVIITDNNYSYAITRLQTILGRSSMVVNTYTGS